MYPGTIISAIEDLLAISAYKIYPAEVRGRSGPIGTYTETGVTFYARQPENNSPLYDFYGFTRLLIQTELRFVNLRTNFF